MCPPAPLGDRLLGPQAGRALAAGIRRSTFSATEATYLRRQRCNDQPAADPAYCFDCPVDPAPAVFFFFFFLLSSDLLRASVSGLCLS